MNETFLDIPKFPYTCANIGLKLSSDELQEFKYNFLRELKALDIIDNYIFYIEYNSINNEQGNLIIGKKPHGFNNIYKNYQFKEIYALNMDIKLYWMIRFDLIYIRQKENNNLKNISLPQNYDAIIDHNLNIIFGTYEYMEFIEKEFFEEKIKINTCKKNYLSNNYINFYCDSFNDIQNFPTLYFQHKNLLYIFEINYRDIFIEYDGKYICLIWFDLNNKNKWRLGKSFLKKYLFTFDIDRKTIGFYNPNIFDNQNSNHHNDNNNKGINTYILIIIIVVLSLISFFLCCYLAKIIYSNKNKITTELENIDNDLLN